MEWQRGLKHQKGSQLDGWIMRQVKRRFSISGGFCEICIRMELNGKVCGKNKRKSLRCTWWLISERRLTKH